MKSIIIFAFVWTAVFGLPANEVKSRNIIVPVGKPEGRITNGFDSRSGQFPYQVYLSKQIANGTRYRCGGTLMSHTEVLTAAHCIVNAVKINIKLGTTNLKAPKLVHTVSYKDVVVHPQWIRFKGKHDIAIIHIPYTNFTEEIYAANLPLRSSSNSTYTGEIAVASGWGRTSDSIARGTAHLQFAYFHVISNKLCGENFDISPTHICVATQKQVSPCKGDSGGPLILENNNTLIGINSAGSNEGCEKNTPAVFTRVTSYLDWILENINVSA